MDFKRVDKKYRPIPFWSWNEKLNVNETKRQVAQMDDAGIGGYFMHARGGLLTEYMSEEWFDNVKAATDEGAKRGMHSWAYDENGWPSGFGGGKVNGLGLDYQQKSLHIEDATEDNAKEENTVLVKDGKRYYYKVNPFYVDVLDERVIAEFIDKIYAEYERKCGHSFDGFFTDEPQILRDTGYPWSFTLEGKFTERYGYSLIENLDALFAEREGSRKVRIDYWQLVTDLFSSSFFKQIYDWCESRGYGFTGHLVLEENMFDQLVSNGACMPHYEYFTMPGMDWLARPVFDCLTPMQLSSAAAQTGKRQILSETFALAGHNVSHAELKRIYEWQMVHGVTMLCTHLEGYSLRGIRKRDYPPAMYYQQPWWEDMNIFFDAASRIGMLLTEGEVEVDTLLMHPQTTAWVLYDGCEPTNRCVCEIMSYHNALLRQMKALEDKHIGYHLGDETLIRRHGRVEDGKFIIGKMSYSKLVLPENLGFLPYTEELIAEFKRQGGKVVTVEEIEPNTVCQPCRLTYTSRKFKDFILHYFVNTECEPITANITVGDRLLLPESGDAIPFTPGEYTFAPYESRVILDYGERKVEKSVEKKKQQLYLGGEWNVAECSYNSLTLDKCDYYFDGELVEKEGYVLNIIPRLCEYRRPVKLRQVYTALCESLPETVFIAVETPENFEIIVNGTRVEKTDCGFFRDSSFRLIDVKKYLQIGENKIEFNSTVVQSEHCYKHLDNSWEFEAMKNCLSYDMEIEPIYIVGDFGLDIKGEVRELERDAYRISEMPVITAMPRRVDISRLDASGFSQFAGRITLEKSFTLEDTELFVTLRGRGVNSIRIAVNGEQVATVMNPPYDVDLSQYLKKGENKITLTLLNNLRNMMGPHHLREGESFSVCPFSFFKESNIFSPAAPGVDGSCHDVLEQWDEDYCFVHYGLIVF